MREACKLTSFAQAVGQAWRRKRGSGEKCTAGAGKFCLHVVMPQIYFEHPLCARYYSRPGRPGRPRCEQSKAKILFPQSWDSRNGEVFNKEVKYIACWIIIGSAGIKVRPRTGRESAGWGPRGCYMRKDLTEEIRDLRKVEYILIKEQGWKWH